MPVSIANINVVLFPDPTSCEEKDLVNLDRFLGSHYMAYGDKSMQSLDLIGQYGCVGDSNLNIAWCSKQW